MTNYACLSFWFVFKTFYQTSNILKLLSVKVFSYKNVQNIYPQGKKGKTNHKMTV